MRKWEIDVLDEKQVLALGADLSKDNEDITETAGFVPLDVKLKRFEEAGMQLQFNTAEFTSNDYRQMYLSPDFEILPEDDLEDIQDKLNARQEFVQNLLAKKLKEKNPDVSLETPDSPPAGTSKKGSQTSEPEEVP